MHSFPYASPSAGLLFPLTSFPQASATAHLNASFAELSSFSHFHPSKGYSWHFPNRPGDKEAATDQVMIATRACRD